MERINHNNQLIRIIALFILIFIACPGCSKIERELKVVTGIVSDITTSSARAGGNIIDLGNGINAHGHCWSISPNPDISDSKTSLGPRTSTGTFTSNLQSLQQGTKYYIKAYAQNKNGVVYGNESSFITTSAVLPTITTTAVSEITQTSAVSGGNITSDGGATITERGVCWAVTTDPEITDNKLSGGSGAGLFYQNINGLQALTKYYVRAYAVNSAGIAYGQSIAFTTLPHVPTVTTSQVISVTTTSASSGGNVISDGGGAISLTGVCWSTSPNPDVNDNIVTNTPGTGSFQSYISGLQPGTTYYLRAFAVNNGGTGYGNEIVFTTDLLDIDGNIYNIVKIGTQFWMRENLRTITNKYGVAIPNIASSSQWGYFTSPAYCWLNNDEGNRNIYGGLYNWYAVSSGALCPSGWHVPSDAEFKTLEMFLGMSQEQADAMLWRGTDQGTQMKNTSGWPEGDTGTNTSGFSGLPGGFRIDTGEFVEYITDGTWWTSSQIDSDHAWMRGLRSERTEVGKNYKNKTNGLYVRCVKD